MTIYKPNNPDRKQEKKLVNTPEIVIDDKLPLTDKVKAGDGGAVLLLRRRPITNTEILRRRRAIRCIMAFLAMSIVVIVALVCALFIHKNILNRPYMGVCQVKFHEDEPYPVGAQGQQGAGPKTGLFDEMIEVDQANEAYEKLDVPPILDFRRATVVHDFEKNLTAIVDRDHGRCFVLPLNRSAVQPPKNFIDLLEKFKSGYYLPNAELVRDSYKVIMPPMEDLEPLGVYIWSDCQFFDTYRLEKDEASDVIMASSALEEDPIVKSKKKRSADCSMIGDGFCLGSTYTEQMRCVSFTDCVN